MEEVNKWLPLLGFFFSALIAIIGVAVSWGKQEAKIDTIKSDYMNRFEQVNSRASNTNTNLSKLEERVSNHKNRLEGKFDLLESKLDERDDKLYGKIDELKDLIIERISK